MAFLAMADSSLSGTMKYQIKWHCADCQTDEISHGSKLEAAFWECNNALVCKQCKSRSGGLTITPDIEIDHEILTHWANNPDVYFWPQDDEIFLSTQSLNVLLDFVENHYSYQNGANQLIEAIPVKLYDEEFVDDAERVECVDWIKNNPRLWEPSFDGLHQRRYPV